MSSVIGLAGNCRMACPCLDGRCLLSHARCVRADSIEPMAPDWLAMHTVPSGLATQSYPPWALYERYVAGKTGKRRRIARPPITELDGRTGSSGTVADGESRDPAASTIDILPP